MQVTVEKLSPVLLELKVEVPADRVRSEVDKAYMEAAKPEGVYVMMYVPHNVHFLWAAASMEGRSADAIAAARDLVTQLDPEMMRAMPMLEYFAPTLSFALVRFGHWDEVLEVPAPPADLAYSTAMWSYARGVAFAATALRAGRSRVSLLSISVVMRAGPWGSLRPFGAPRLRDS